MESVAIIDNHDSFTYNLVGLLRKASPVLEIEVFLTENMSEEIFQKYSSFLISPGPGLPGDFPELLFWTQKMMESKKVLGICLGHQAIALSRGASLIHSGRIMHGKTSIIEITCPENAIWEKIPSSFRAVRYHSWLLDPATLNDDFQITCQSAEGEVMGIQYKNKPVFGFQFHPESWLSEYGLQIIQNWLKL